MATVDAQTEKALRIADRRERFEQLGYSLADAAELALSDVDWRQIEALISRGCPPDIARRIAE